MSRVRSLACLVCLMALACGDEFREFDASVPYDAGIPDEGAGGEGGVPVKAVFTVSGCDRLEFDAMARPSCTASRGRPLTFIALGVHVETLLWSFESGSPSSSTALTPEVRWTSLGTYNVSLAAGGNGGSALGSGLVNIVAGSAGATCRGDEDCDASSGLRCLCGAGGCPAALAGGLCARRCEAQVCVPGERCVDLTRGGQAALPDGGVADAGADEPFRVRACLPSCTSSTSCRAGFACLELPTVTAGVSDADYSWARACFADVLGQVGEACLDPDGNPDGSRCLTGRCEALGARGLCTDACDASHPCPSNAACALVPNVGARCLPRCTAGASCDDPLLACQGPGAGGLGYAFVGAEPAGTLLCAPKRCAAPSDCEPAGSCSSIGGALFCLR